MRPKTAAYLIAAIFLLTAAVAAAPTAQAQVLDPACKEAATPSLRMKEAKVPPEPIRPMAGAKEIKFDLVYEVGSGTSLTPVPISITVTADDPSWTDVSWSPQTEYVIFDPNQQGETHDFTVTASVAFSDQAPAFRPTNIKISAEAGSGTCVTAPANLNEQATTTVGFFESYQARFDRAIFQTGQNSQVQIPMTLENFGNGNIKLRFSLAEQSSAHLQLPIPPEVTVRSLAAGASTETSQVNIDVQTPFKNGYENRRDALIMNIKGNPESDPEKELRETQISAVIQTQGVYVPGFEVVSMLAALLGSIFVVGRRRS